MSSVRDEFLAAVTAERDRQWGHTPTEAYEAVTRVANLDKPSTIGSPGATAQARWLLRVAATCLAAVEADPSMWKVGKPDA